MKVKNKIIFPALLLSGVLTSSFSLGGCRDSVGAGRDDIEKIEPSFITESNEETVEQPVEQPCTSSTYPFPSSTVGFLWEKYDDNGIPISGIISYANSAELSVLTFCDKLAVVKKSGSEDGKDKYTDFLRGQESNFECSSLGLENINEFRFYMSDGEYCDIWEEARLWKYDGCIYDSNAILGNNVASIEDVSKAQNKQYIELMEMPEFSAESENTAYLHYVSIDDFAISFHDSHSKLIRLSDFNFSKDEFFNSLRRSNDMIPEESQVVPFRDYVLENSDHFDVSLVSFLETGEAGVYTVTDEEIQRSCSASIVPSLGASVKTLAK